MLSIDPTRASASLCRRWALRPPRTSYAHGHTCEPVLEKTSAEIRPPCLAHPASQCLPLELAVPSLLPVSQVPHESRTRASPHVRTDGGPFTATKYIISGGHKTKTCGVIDEGSGSATVAAHRSNRSTRAPYATFASSWPPCLSPAQRQRRAECSRRKCRRPEQASLTLDWGRSCL